MVDIVEPSVRSRMMAGIRGRNTKPELIVRSYLHRSGFRFRLQAKLPGKPDIALPKYKTVVFVHGCFWHRHAKCGLAYTPKTRGEFWSEKFAANVARDERAQAELAKLGWRVLVIWECELRKQAR